MDGCLFPECERKVRAKGYCGAHYAQQSRGTPLHPCRTPPPNGSYHECRGPECVKPAETKGLCGGHYSQLLRGVELNPLYSTYGKNTWYLGKDGYIKARFGKRIVAQHRLFMEQHIGRALIPGENVHHINGDRSDNRMENLELWNTNQPAGQRVEDKIAWAREILKLYGAE